MNRKTNLPAEFVDEMSRDIRALVARMPGGDPGTRLVGFLCATLASEGCGQRAAFHKLAAAASAIASDHVHVTVIGGTEMTCYGPNGVAVQVPAPAGGAMSQPAEA